MDPERGGATNLNPSNVASSLDKCREVDTSLAMLASVVESSGDAIIGLTTEGYVTSWNPAAERMYGYSATEMIGRRPVAIIPSDRREEFESILEKIRQGGQINQFETVRLRKDGKQVYVSVTATPIKDNTGSLMGFSWAARDITSRKKVEEELRLARFTLDHATDLIFWIGEDARIYDVNESACRRYGYSCADLRSMTMLDINPTYTREIWKARWNKVKKEGWLLYETVNRAKDGSLFPVEIAASYLKFGDQELVSAYSRDITRRKQAEKALRDSEERYRAIFKQSAVGIARVSPGYHFIEANQRFSDITGYSPEELLARTFPEITYPEDIDKDVLLARDLVSGKINDYSIEKRYIRKDGSLVWIYLTVALVRSPDGTPIYFVSVIQDISDRKQAQEALVEAKNQSDLYVDIMAHDINNLNQVALLNIELLQLTENLGEEERELIDNVGNSVQGSVSIIENVRKIQSITSENIQLTPEGLDGMITRCIKDVPRPQGKKVQIRFEPGEGRMVRGEPLLKEAFCNLINNSIKYSGADVTIDIEVKEVLRDDGKYYSTSISDNGYGIPDEVKPKLFQRFQRGTTRAHGKGLGLYIVRMLVERFGGEVQVEDRVPGDHTMGARFVVLLPAAES